MPAFALAGITELRLVMGVRPESTASSLLTLFCKARGSCHAQWMIPVETPVLPKIWHVSIPSRLGLPRSACHRLLICLVALA